MDESLLKELWLQKLPDYAQAILVAAKCSPLGEVAEMADSITERMRPCAPEPGLPAVTASASFQPIRHCDSDLRAEIAALRNEVRNLRRGRQSRSRAPPRQRSGSSKRIPICRIHWKYGDEARNCFKPCSYHASKAGNPPADA